MEMIAIIGGGAIGSVFAADLADAGHDVLLCTRRLSPGGNLRVDRENLTSAHTIDTVTDPREVREPADWVMVATKTYDTLATTNWLNALVGPDTKVVVLQNGIDQVERLRPLVPVGTPVLPALIYIAAELVEPGHVRWTYGQRVAVPADPVAEQFAALFPGTGLHVVVEPAFASSAWKKILVNIVMNPITTLTGRRMEVFRISHIDQLGLALQQEVMATAHAAGVNLTIEDLAEARDVIADVSPESGTSMLYDRLAGKPTEHEQILGAVVRTADAVGVPVPSTKALLALLRALPTSWSGTGELTARG